MNSALHCPVCPAGSELRVLDPLPRLQLRRCDVCLGVLADASTVALATSYYHPTHYVMSEGHGHHSCRNCGALFDQWRERCRVCLKSQTVGCVRCLMPMELVEVAGVALDVCKQCRVVWFDRGELGLLTGRHSAELQRGLTPVRNFRAVSELGNLALHSPEALFRAGELARVSGDTALSALSELSVSGAVEVTGVAGEGAVEIAAGAIDVLLSVFDAF